MIAVMLGWIGIYSAMALAALGSIVGCTRAGQAACGAMLETESGHGRFVGIAAMPASQTIYGIVVMLALNRPLTADNSAAIFVIGVLGGTVLGASAYFQGLCCASAIDAAKNKSEIFGLAVAPAAIVEGFAVFAFAFALLLAGGLPKG